MLTELQVLSVMVIAHGAFFSVLLCWVLFESLQAATKWICVVIALVQLPIISIAIFIGQRLTGFNPILCSLVGLGFGALIWHFLRRRVARLRP